MEHLAEIISFSKYLHSMKEESRASISRREIMLILPLLMPLLVFLFAMDVSSPHHGTLLRVCQTRYPSHLSWPDRKGGGSLPGSVETGLEVTISKKEGRFGLDIRNKFFTGRLVSY